MAAKPGVKEQKARGSECRAVCRKEMQAVKIWESAAGPGNGTELIVLSCRWMSLALPSTERLEGDHAVVRGTMNLVTAFWAGAKRRGLLPPL